MRLFLFVVPFPYQAFLVSEEILQKRNSKTAKAKQRPGSLGKTKENSGSWHSNRGGTSVPAALGPPPTPHVHGDRDVGEGKEDLGRDRGLKISERQPVSRGTKCNKVQQSSTRRCVVQLQLMDSLFSE